MNKMTHGINQMFLRVIALNQKGYSCLTSAYDVIWYTTKRFKSTLRVLMWQIPFWIEPFLETSYWFLCLAKSHQAQGYGDEISKYVKTWIDAVMSFII